MADSDGISQSAAAAIRAVIALAGGREVCFVATLDDNGMVAAVRAVARGDSRSVLSLPGCARRGEMVLHNHPSGNLDPSEADLEVAHAVHLDGVGFAIVNNDATDIYIVVEVPRAPLITPLVPAGVSDELTSSGRVALALEGYEERASQQELTRTIVQLYNGDRIGVLEAGTGVGKSFAYLLPALRWSALNGERTVVSTNTINLQEQLTGNDLPLLKRALSDQNVSFTLLKGWRNYICLNRLESASRDAATLFDEGGAGDLQHLVQWAMHTENGSLSDLPVQPRAEVWDEVAAESDLCTRHRCKYFQNCFFFRARREAAHADIVVVNHHLLMADVVVRRATQNWAEAAVLPAYDRLVIDEAHHLEGAAAKHLGLTVSRVGVARLLSRLERRGKGLLGALRLHFAGQKNVLEGASYELIDERMLPSLAASHRLVTDVFDLLAQHLRQHNSSAVRLTPEFGEDQLWRDGLGRSLDDLLRELKLLSDALDLLRERITASDTGEEDPPIVAELRGVARRLGSAGDALHTALRPAHEEAPSVRWIESRGSDQNVMAATVPLDLSHILRRDLFRRVKTAVVTSATLSTNGSFDFVRGRLGLTAEDVEPRSAIFPSAFHFEDQSLLAVPLDFPIPSEEPEEHRSATVGAIADLCGESDGGIFVLCTSHKDVRAIASALRQGDMASQRPLLVHGEEESRDMMLRRFRDSGRAILVGTTSFWEGVDVRGNALRGLVITRLPFRVPTEPITAAQCEAIAAAGGDPFTDYLLPHAALRLKQGFGRLIRSSTDWGAVLIADPRVVLRNYGEVLIESLPPARRVFAPWVGVRAALRKFYQQRRG